MDAGEYEAQLAYLRIVDRSVHDWAERHDGQPPDRDTLGNIERGARWEVEQQAGAAPGDGPAAPVESALARHEAFVDLSLKLWRLEYAIEHGAPPPDDLVREAAGRFESTALLAEVAIDTALPAVDEPLDPPTVEEPLDAATRKFVRLYRRVRRANPPSDAVVHFAWEWQEGSTTSVDDLVREASEAAATADGAVPYDRRFEYARLVHDRLRDWTWRHRGESPDPESLAAIEIEARQETDAAGHDRPMPDLTVEELAARRHDFVAMATETWGIEFRSRTGRPPTEEETRLARVDIEFEAIETWGRPAGQEARRAAEHERRPDRDDGGVEGTTGANEAVPAGGARAGRVSRTVVAVGGLAVIVLSVVVVLVSGLPRGSTPGAAGTATPGASVAVGSPAASAPADRPPDEVVSTPAATAAEGPWGGTIRGTSGPGSIHGDLRISLVAHGPADRGSAEHVDIEGTLNGMPITIRIEPAAVTATLTYQGRAVSWKAPVERALPGAPAAAVDLVVGPSGVKGTATLLVSDPAALGPLFGTADPTTLDALAKKPLVLAVDLAPGLAVGGVASPAASIKPPIPADICALVTRAAAARILGSPVTLTPAPLYCSVAPTTGTADVGGVKFASVTIAVTPETGPTAYAAAESAAQAAGRVKAIAGLGDRAFYGASGLAVLQGTSYVLVGHVAIFDTASLGSDAPLPVVEQFARLVLAGLGAGG